MDDMSVLVAEPVDVLPGLRTREKIRKIERTKIEPVRIEPAEKWQDIEWSSMTSAFPGGWPRDLIEAHNRYPGPYNGANAAVILDEENVEIYNGWLVFKKMTAPVERRILGTAHSIMDLTARHLGFGQILPDQLECQLHNKDIVKPDASLVSWERLETRVGPVEGGKRDILYGGPELVIEARSPSNRRTQEKRKRSLYFASDVQIVWDIDEKNQRIYVYHASAPEDPEEYGIDDEIHCETFLPGWRAKVADFFAPRASAETIAGQVAEAWRGEAFVEGKEEGFTEGKEEGFTEGKEEGFTEGKEEGFVVGKEEGVTEGIAKGMIQLMPLLVQMRFGLETQPDLADRLSNCDVSQLQTLQQAVTTAESLDAWLAMI